MKFKKKGKGTTKKEQETSNIQYRVGELTGEEAE